MQGEYCKDVRRQIFSIVINVSSTNIRMRNRPLKRPGSSISSEQSASKAFAAEQAAAEQAASNSSNAADTMALDDEILKEL
jgi:hypothetical protein